MAIAEKTGHSRETVAARIKTGEVNFATSQVVHASKRPNPRLTEQQTLRDGR